MKSKKLILWLLFIFVLSISVYASSHLPPGLLKLQQYEQQLAKNVNFLIALLAGIISFTSPCGFALLPAFFTFMFKERKKAVLMTSAFSLGLTLAFAIFGFIAAIFGEFFNELKLNLAVVSGAFLIFFSVLLFLNKGFALFNFKMDAKKDHTFFSIFSLGLFFGVGWTPCVGPVLAGILVLAANTSTVLSGTLNLVFYGIGVSLPLLLIAMFSDKYDWAKASWLRGKGISFKLVGKEIQTHTYNIIAGLLLFFIGLLMVLYQGTFFFQTDFLNYVPWSMAFWDYLNEMFINSPLLVKKYMDIIALALILILAFIIVKHIRRKKKESK